MKVVILAGGFGTRLGELTNHTKTNAESWKHSNYSSYYELL